MAEITNPIVLGESITDKEFHLDINVTVNNIFLLNLEMQITNKPNWQNRSISYLCRSFVHINLRVIDLTQIHLATKKDKEYQIDYWTFLFNTVGSGTQNMVYPPIFYHIIFVCYRYHHLLINKKRYCIDFYLHNIVFLPILYLHCLCQRCQ